MTAGSGAGYGGTPLLQKLGVRDGFTLTLVGAPAEVIDDLPASVTVRRRARGSSDVVVAFFTRRQDLERRMEALSRVIYPNGGLWIAWPKKSSGVETTVNEDVVRAAALSGSGCLRRMRVATTARSGGPPSRRSWTRPRGPSSGCHTIPSGCHP